MVWTTCEGCGEKTLCVVMAGEALCFSCWNKTIVPEESVCND